MPLNLIKQYNQHLDIGALNPYQRNNSLWAIFKRDVIENNSFKFLNKQITPTPFDGAIKMETLFTHLTTVIVDKVTRKREYEYNRSCRLHWVRFHIDRKKTENVLIFSVEEPGGDRTYIYDKDEKYVIVLEPLRVKNEYYLLSAYYLTGKDAQRDKIIKKYKRKTAEVL